MHSWLLKELNLMHGLVLRLIMFFPYMTMTDVITDEDIVK